MTSDSAGTIFLAGEFAPGAGVSGAPRGREGVVTAAGVSLPVVRGTFRYTVHPGRP